MKKGTAVLLSVLGAMCLAGAPAFGQTMVPKLTDADVRRILPVMMAEAAEAQKASRETADTLENLQRIYREREKRLKDFDSGKIDPLAYLKQHAKHIAAPPSAVYQPKLSRVATLWTYGDPIAVFSYGIDSEEVRNLSRGGEEAARQYANFGDVYKEPAGQKIKAVEEEFKSFYAARGFTDLEFTEVPGWSCISPDRGANVWFVFLNLFAGAKDAETIPDGPILLIGLTEYFSPGEKPQPVEKPESAPTMGMDQALRQAGMSEEQYREYVGALVTARNDAADPSAIDPKNTGLDFHGPMDPEMKKTIQEMKAIYEIRRQNSLLYNKHRTVLDPILTSLGQ